ncbi:MAG: nicotinamide-nucleotide amidohydrolase family protein [Treponema sp.]|jgi:PncC family amidohydrolase|nr:nicotinamide-nucleotide amidohydrolase family protein [Treponema sp.]
MDNAVELVKRLTALSLRAALAESCTAGLVANLIAEVPGASKVFWGSFVTYTVEAKARMLGLDIKKINANGAVSRETALAMAEGALAESGADLAAAVTGLAGPDGDGSATPVGTIWIATALRDEGNIASVFHFAGDRNAVRSAAAEEVIRALLARIE